MSARNPHRLEREFGSGLRQPGEDAPAVKPTRALLPEDLLPVNVSRSHLRGGAVGRIGAAERWANAESPLGEVQPVTHCASDPVVRNPVELGTVDSALVHEIFNQPADGIVDERGYDRSSLPEAALEAARDVVLAAALPGLERTRRCDSCVAR